MLEGVQLNFRSRVRILPAIKRPRIQESILMLMEREIFFIVPLTTVELRKSSSGGFSALPAGSVVDEMCVLEQVLASARVGSNSSAQNWHLRTPRLACDSVYVLS